MTPDRDAAFTDHDGGFQCVGLSRQPGQVVPCVREVARLVESFVFEGEHLVPADHQSLPRLGHAHGFQFGKAHRLIAHLHTVCAHRGAEGFLVDIGRNGFSRDAGRGEHGAAAGAAGGENDTRRHR